MIVPTHTVKVAKGCEPTERDIRLIAPYIEREGLIEPLKLNKDNEIGTIDPYDPARLEYCKRAGWETVIVAHDDEAA
jgi:ParB-like chromosome segregation protein Spo0J